MQNFMELDMKKIFRSQNSDIWGLWGLKTSLRQFGPAQRTYQPISQET